jgi:hypothetical protein
MRCDQWSFGLQEYTAKSVLARFASIFPVSLLNEIIWCMGNIMEYLPIKDILFTLVGKNQEALGQSPEMLGAWF